MIIFRKKKPTYSYGFQPGPGTWQDPLYECPPYTQTCQAAPCAQNYVILMSDGGWDIPDCSVNSDPVQQAFFLHTGGPNGSLRSDFSGITIQDLYAIYLGNLGTQNYQWNNGYGTIFGQNALENIAYFGSFEPIGSVNQSDFPSASCIDNTDCGGPAQGSLCTAPPQVPDTFFSPNNASKIKSSLMNAFSSIIKQASSGSSVASISQKTQQGSSAIQAIFYPQKIFDNNTQVNWIGYLYDWWLYSPVGSQTVSILNANTQNYLEPQSDYTLNFVLNNGQLQAQEYLNNNLVNTVSIESAQSALGSG
ncbi:MAG: hypothetical protein ACP5PO_05955 [Desulfurella sp.]|uniref:hypothetical protein n=1 Tax=Desulfurella sp. TaxID=1962857 RepID=UPI003D0C539B